MGHLDLYFTTLLVLNLSSVCVNLSGNQSCSLSVLNNNTLDTMENITAMENAVAEFTFSLNDCWIGENIKLFVFKEHEPYECVLFQTDDKCKRSSSTTTCSCVQNGTYFFKKTVYRSDNGLWLFTVRRGNVVNPTDDEILTRTTFFITHPANVTRLEVDGNISEHPQILSRNQSTVVCHWENGNPPVKARLIDSRGNELTYETNGTTLNYTVTTLDCYKTKDIHCKTDGSENKLTASLLKKCPPKFISSSPLFIILGTGNISFDILSHTSNITECTMYKLTEEINSYQAAKEFPSINNPYMCNGTHEASENVSCTTSLGSVHSGKTCLYNITGTAPELLLNLNIYDFTKQDFGNWSLTLFNSEGCDQTFFSIGTIDGKPSLDHTYVIVTGVVAIIILVIVFIIKAAVIMSGILGHRQSVQINKRRDCRFPTQYAMWLINLCRGGNAIVVSDMDDGTGEIANSQAPSTTGGVGSQEETMVNGDIYAKVMKKDRGHPVINAFHNHSEYSQSYDNPCYEVVSRERGIDIVEKREVRQYANILYETLNLTHHEKKCDIPNVSQSLLYSENETTDGEVGVIENNDISSPSGNSKCCSPQSSVLHIRSLAEARKFNYMDVTMECLEENGASIKQIYQ